MEEEVKLEDIFLSNVNPRFKSDWNIESINGDFFRDSQHFTDKNNIECMYKILQFEEEFDNLLELFKSISKGYNSILEKPYLIETKVKANEKKKFITIEGNRRILILKCLSGEITFNVSSENISNHAKKNIKKIEKIISEHKKITVKTINSTIIEKNKDETKHIQIAIFSNHITGDKLGKRNWNRGKTFDMYINFWETTNGNDQEKIEQISTLLNRSETNIKDNLNSANLILYLIKKANKNKNDFFAKNRVSGLELQYIKKFINYKNNKRFEKHIKYNKSLNNNKNIFEIKSEINLSIEKLCLFILESFENRYFDTRGVKEKFGKEISIKLSNIFEETKKLNEKDFNKSIRELKNININELIENKEKIKNEDSRNFINFVEKNNEYFNKVEINYESPILTDKILKPFSNIFISLFNQYKILINEPGRVADYPVNGIMSTFRSLLENISYILMYESTLLKEFKKDKNIFSNIKKDNESLEKMKSKELEDLEFKDIFLKTEFSELQKTYTFLRKNIKNDNIKKLIIESFQKITNNKSIKEITNFKGIFSQDIFQNTSRLIHSPHQFYLKNNNDLKNQFDEGGQLLKQIIDVLKKIKIIKNI